jgi:hypothetical protein
VVLCVAIVGGEPTTGKRQRGASAPDLCECSQQPRALGSQLKKEEKVRREKEEEALGKPARPLP